MNADGPATGMNFTRRMAQYVGTIEMLARRGAVSGRPGPWLDIARRAAETQKRLSSGPDCDVALHALYLELTLWGQMLEAYVLPEFHADLAAAIHRVAREETRDLDELTVHSLGLVCPEDHSSSPAPQGSSASLEELILVRQLQEATRRATATALEGALRSVLALSGMLCGDSEHSKCEAWDVLTVRDVTIRALAETMPRAYRRVLADFAQHAFYGLYAPDEETPQFLDQVPRHMMKGDNVWTFTSTWSGVAQGWSKDEAPDRGPHPWLIEGLAGTAHRWEEEEAERTRQTMDRLNRQIQGD